MNNKQLNKCAKDMLKVLDEIKEKLEFLSKKNFTDVHNLVKDEGKLNVIANELLNTYSKYY